MLGSVSPSTAQDLIWNLRTPEWEAVWPTMANPEEARQRLIHIASEIIGYTGLVLPAEPIGPMTNEAPMDGHVLVGMAWLEAGDAELVFGVARGWGHRKLGHVLRVFESAEADIAAWREGERFTLADEVEADIYAARFLADFGYDPQPLFAALCLRHETSESDKVWTDGQRVDLTADTMEKVLGLRPETLCGPDAVVILGSCTEQHDACLANVDLSVNVCH